MKHGSGALICSRTCQHTGLTHNSGNWGLLATKTCVVRTGQWRPRREKDEILINNARRFCRLGATGVHKGTVRTKGLRIT